MLHFQCKQCNEDKLISDVVKKITGFAGKVDNVGYQLKSVSGMCMETYPCQHSIKVVLSFPDGSEKTTYITRYGTEIQKILNSMGNPKDLCDFPEHFEMYKSRSGIGWC